MSKLQLGTAFEHLYYLLEAAVAGLGPAIAPEPLVAEDLAAGRLIAPWGFAATGGFWCWHGRMALPMRAWTRWPIGWPRNCADNKKGTEGIKSFVPLAT